MRMVRNNIAASLPGMDAFTGYDSVTAFASKGKIIAHKLVKDSWLHQEALGLLESQTEVGIGIRYRLSWYYNQTFWIKIST